MTKKSAVTITITKGKHKSQPFTATIDKPGKAEPYKMSQRYSRKDAAVRGALRNLGAVNSYPRVMVGGVLTPIKFVFVDATKRKK